ncbi:MAG: hypothetical protein EB832_03235 [Thaumarchaeota archaeon S14]|nr:MAG: hypothetical protein EB832_03235 [Thaumarchaeota archaeon S14]
MGASSPIPQVRLWHLKWQSARQAAAGVQMSRLLDGIKAQAQEHREWLSEGGGAWDGISAACGKKRLDALSARLGLGALASPRDAILAGLSTVATYGTTWDMLLESTAGSARRGFLAIRQMEDAVNRIAQDAFYRASYYYRGLSIVELEAICSGKILPGPAYSFVSLSADPVAAMRFAANLSNRPYITHVVLAIDAHMARKLGAIPAVYSIASDVVDLRSRSESISRTFQLRYAYELQAHFAHKWPHGSAAMAKSVITLLDPLSVASRLAREMSVPCVPYRDLVPVIARQA